MATIWFMIVAVMVAIYVLLDGFDPLRIFQHAGMFNSALGQANALENLDLRPNKCLIGRDLTKEVVQRLNLKRVGLDVQAYRGFINRRHLK